MKVFLIEGDEGEDRIVEASSMREAIEFWSEWQESKGIIDAEPTGAHLMHEEPVLRLESLKRLEFAERDE